MSPGIRTGGVAALLLLTSGCKVVLGPSGQSIPLMCSPPYFAGHTFTHGTQQTDWALCFDGSGSHGLTVSGVMFRPSATAQWTTVLWEGQFADVFVPYHNGDMTYRFHDLQWGYLIPLTQADCPASEGAILRDGNRVCEEVRPTGIAWRDSNGARRGSELVLWGVYDMGNYKMIMEWSFRDDGVLQSRAGATGYNAPNYPFVAHMHNVLWRLDVDMAGAEHDHAALLTHWETTTAPVATDVRQPILTEVGVSWDAAQFTALEVEDGLLKNSRGHNSGYHLIPIRTGTGQHQEPFTQHNLWVTQFNATWSLNCNGVPEEGWDLPCYTNGQAVDDADLVVWYFGSLHHHPRDEDGVAGTSSSGNTFTGVTPVMWTGFMLMPHNLFDAPPLWP